MPNSGFDDGCPDGSATMAPYTFDRNDPFDRNAPIHFVIPRLIESPLFMKSMREFNTPAETLALWYLGQNGFILKFGAGPLIGIDLYLTNSCASKFAHLPYRLDRQLPVFVEREDLDIDIFIELGCSVTVQGIFALPTDGTDLNHAGSLLRFFNGTTFYNTGDTAYAERLAALLPVEVDICAICINGGFHNLSPMEAALIVKAVRPRVAIPCHYDMMINNVGSPGMLRIAMDVVGSKAVFKLMKYYEPWLYRRN